MFFKRTTHHIPAALLVGLLFLANACTVDKNYEINDKTILDPTVTVFQDGITVPVGSSDEISLDDILKLTGKDLDDFLKKAADGSLSIDYAGSVSLNDRIKELNIQGLASMDGVSFTQEFNYHIGNFDAKDFGIDAQHYAMMVNFEGIDVLDVQPKPISATPEGLSYHAGLDAFKDVIKDNEDFDLSAKIGAVVYNQPVLERSKIDEQVALIPPMIENIPVPQEILGDLEIPSTTAVLSVNPPVVLDENISKISNVKTSKDAKLWVKLSMSNVFMTEGKVVPDVSLDFGSLLKLEGGNVVNAKDMVLNSDNEWSATKSIGVLGLRTTEYEGAISIQENVPVSGTVTISDAATTRTKLAATAGDVQLNIEVYFTDFIVESADITIKDMEPFTTEAEINLGEFDEAQLTEQIEDVMKIVLDETKPLTLKITPKNLDRIKEKNLNYNFTFSFPEGLKVKDAVDGKLSISGDLANGPVEVPIVIQEIYPKVQNRTVVMDAAVGVSATVEPKNIVINSAQLPTSPEEDLSFAVSLNGTPVITDYQIKLKSYEEVIKEGAMGGTLEFKADELGDFGAFHITPEGAPALNIQFDIPDIKGLSLSPGNNGLKFVLPDVLVFDADEIAADLNFNTEENSITLMNSFPQSISLPIKELYVKPVKEGDSYKVSSKYDVAGSVKVPGTEISQAELKDYFGSDVGITVDISEIKAKSITLDDEISIPVNQKFKVTVKHLPEQLKRIDEIVLEDVFLNLDATFDGLPSSDEAPFTVDLTISLPEFIQPSEVKLTGEINNGTLSVTPVKLEKIVNIVPEEEKSEDGEVDYVLKDDIVIAGNIVANGANIDLTQLKPDITASLTGSLMNKETGKIAISKASGVFSYEISESTRLNLDELPDALKDESIKLDLADPQLTLDIKSNIGIPMSANLTLIPYRNDVAQEALVFNNIELPYSTSIDNVDIKKYQISKTKPTGNDRVWLEADISSLLKEIPDYMEVKIDALVSDEKESLIEIVAGKDYTLDIDYGIHVPLAFGPEFNLSAETEFDLSGAAAITSYGEFGFKGLVRNDTPLELKVIVELLDAEGVVIPQKEEYDKPLAIHGNVAADPVEFFLSSADRSREIDKARLKIVVTAIPNVQLKATDCLQFKDFVVVAPEGITVKF